MVVGNCSNEFGAEQFHFVVLLMEFANEKGFQYMGVVGRIADAEMELKRSGQVA